MDVGDEGTKGDSSLSDLQMQIVWLVRVLLPIFLFVIWYRSQGQHASGGKYRYARDALLAVRKVVDGEAAPDSISDLKLLDEVAVQKALGGPAPRARGGSDAGSRPGTSNRPKKAAADKARPSGDSRRSPGSRGGLEGDLPFAGATATTGSATISGRQALTEEERVHLESLLNFAAFSHKDRPRRVFLPSNGQPPPPPRRAALKLKADPLEEAKVNSEAQMVLKGANSRKIQLKCPEIAKNLFQQLVDSHVRASEATFSLMVEVCVNGGDLKGASDFLMKMETAGFSADSELLDKVMDLYSESWSNGDTGGGPAAGSAASTWPPTSSTGGHGGTVAWEGEDDEDALSTRRAARSPTAVASSGSLTRRPSASSTSLRPGAGRPASSSTPAARPSKRDSDKYGVWSDDGEDFNND